ncbi:MAG TPA: hypothetical protein PKW15_06195 [Alphaproteobacteria bacterium]|nr:hypothetical protein [Rhodospirillaceae bacterium]HRJ12816.1 hypothetical protein [Alphaproteobacteria bacterium]
MSSYFQKLLRDSGKFLAEQHNAFVRIAELPQLEGRYSYGLAYNGAEAIVDKSFYRERPAYALYGNNHTTGHIIQDRRGTLDIRELTHWRYDTINDLPTVSAREEKIRMHYEIDYEATCIALTLLRDAHEAGYLKIDDEDFYNVLVPAMIAHYRHDVSLHIGTLENGEPPVFGTDITQTPCHPWVAERDLIIYDKPIEVLPVKRMDLPLVFHVHRASQDFLPITENMDMKLRRAAQKAYGGKTL